MKKGFTLIELLVVVLIIGILAAIALPQYQWAVEKSRVAEAMTVLRTFKDAQERFYLANGQYAADLSLLDIEMPVSANWIYMNAGISVAAYRIPAGFIKSYVIAFRWDTNDLNRIICRSDPDGGVFGDKICPKLGAKVKNSIDWVLAE